MLMPSLRVPFGLLPKALTIRPRTGQRNPSPESSGAARCCVLGSLGICSSEAGRTAAAGTGTASREATLTSLVRAATTGAGISGTLGIVGAAATMVGGLGLIAPTGRATV